MSNGHRGNRLRKGWLPIPTGTQDFTAAATAILNSASFTGPGTILRMLGEYVVFPTGGGTFAPADNATISVGIALVSTDAVVVGGSAMPDPGGESEYPWLYWASHSIATIVVSAEANVGDISVVRKSFDIRSMRKFKERESLAMIVEYTDVSGAPPLTVRTGVTRVLVGL